ncbi:MAG TPA: TonB family protein, partial [Desulfomonilia bacterium]|nr:TonB family protein [Desulfomonilia bacterium]
SITFVLNERGEVADIGVLKSSGSYSLDSAAMAAIEDAAPFGPLTDNNGEKTLKVTGHFAYVLD